MKEERVVTTHQEIRRRCKLHDFEIELWASLSYKERESLLIFVHSRFEQDEFVVQVLWRIHIIIINEKKTKWAVFQLSLRILPWICPHYKMKTNCESFTIANVNGIIIRQLFFQWHNKFSFFCCSARHAFKNNLKVRFKILQNFTLKGHRWTRVLDIAFLFNISSLIPWIANRNILIFHCKVMGHNLWSRPEMSGHEFL